MAPIAKPSGNVILPLSKAEEDLIRLIRTKYRFGSITIETRDGKPYRIEERVRYDKLG